MAREKTEVETIPETIYAAEDFISNSSIFETQPECVEAALKLAGVTKATEKQARKIINDFLHKEVK